MWDCFMKGEWIVGVEEYLQYSKGGHDGSCLASI